MNKPNLRPGSTKIFFVLFILAAIGITVVAAGTFLYVNRERVFSKTVASEESTPADSSGSSTPGRRPVVASAPIHANERTYATYAMRDDVLVLVDYYADWCGPCRNIAPSLSRLASAHGDKVVVLKVNVDREKTLARRAGIRSIPDVRLLHAGSQLERHTGGRSYGFYESLVLKHAGRLPEVAAPAQPQPASGGGSITPLEKDWLPPGVQPSR